MNLSDFVDHTGITQDTFSGGSLPGVNVSRDTKVSLKF
jgi:hypothetical protein